MGVSLRSGHLTIKKTINTIQMKSIFNPENNQEIIDRFIQLTPNSQAKWGKMTVFQMLKHCQALIDVAFDTLQLKPNFFFQFFSKITYEEWDILQYKHLDHQLKQFEV